MELSRKLGRRAKESDKRVPASEAMVELAIETWRLDQLVARTLPFMDPFDADRFESQYGWYQRVAKTALEELGLSVVDLTGKAYDVGMAATALNLEDFAHGTYDQLVVSQMIEPIVMESGTVRRPGTMMLAENAVSKPKDGGEALWDIM